MGPAAFNAVGRADGPPAGSIPVRLRHHRRHTGSTVVDTVGPDTGRRQLPGIGTLLGRDDVAGLVDAHGRAPTVDALRVAVATARAAVADGDPAPTADELVVVATAALRVERDARTRAVVNATGVVLHTNLGRAPLAPAAIDAMVAAAGPSTVEYDPATRSRGRRDVHVARLLVEATGAEDATVTNNGAAALVLALAAVAGGRRVVVSRGELVEIGGSFRLPDIVAAAGVDLVEVGTTNRTRVEDVARAAAADPAVAAVLRVHPSNFSMRGFVARPDPAQLARAAHDAGIVYVHDVGSGLLDPAMPVPSGEDPEPDVTSAVAEGADLVVASGDKLLGGPQAGLLVGTTAAVGACRAHPLARALRVDKVRLAALEATLRLHRGGELAGLPTWAALTADPAEVADRASRLAARLAVAGVTADVVATEGRVGGGSLPDRRLPSSAVRLDGDPEAVAAALHAGDPPVVGRIHDGALLLDLRTVPDDLVDRLGDLVVAALVP